MHERLESSTLIEFDSTQCVSGASDETQHVSSTAGETQSISSAANSTPFFLNTPDQIQFVSITSDPTQIIPSDPPAYNTIAHSCNNLGFNYSTGHLMQPHLQGHLASNDCHDHQPSPYTPSSSYCVSPKPGTSHPGSLVDGQVEALQWPEWCHQCVTVVVPDENGSVEGTGAPQQS